MKTYNYTFVNNHFKDEIDYTFFKNKKNILIQIFCGQNESTLQYLSNIISENLPHAICLGATTDGEIKDGNVSKLKTIISISVFEKTTLKASIIEGTNSFENGFNLANEILEHNTKLIITFTGGITTNAEEHLKGISKANASVIVAGGMAGDNGAFKQTFISYNKTLTSCGAVAVSLNSYDLEVTNDYKFDWTPIGLEHVIEDVQDNRIYSISGMTPVDFYKKYLGNSVSQTEFPLIIQNNGVSTARAVLSKHSDGSFSCGGNLKQGDIIRIGFGDVRTLMKEPLKNMNKICKVKSETFFIYSCMARRRFLQDLIKLEIEPFANAATTSGFFTYSEFYHNQGVNQLLNQSVSVISLNENCSNDLKSINDVMTNKPINKTDSYPDTIQALTNLIQQSALDYDKQSNILQEQKNYSNNLLKNQKVFLRHAVHETNTPLSVIMSNIELHEMEFGRSEYLSNIEVALKNIFSIYDDLSYLIKKDQISYRLQNIDLVDFIRSRVDFFSKMAIQMKSNIFFEINAPTMLINFSETKLQRIIDNNLTNAIKYTYEGKDIHVRLEAKNKNFKFYVSSHSKMIQHPQKIFEEYYREEKSKEGFGLGLNLVKRICDEEGVIIKVDSNEDGTCFTYTFKGNL